MTGPTAQQASAYLERADEVALEDDRARRVHSRVSIGHGLVFGTFAAGVWVADGTRWGGLVTFGAQIVFLVAVLVLTRHRETAVRTVPRRARRIAAVGTICSGIPFLALTWFVFIVDLPLPAPLLAALAGLVIAAPAVVAGLLIRRGGLR
ncbi:hypothetical protein ACH436_07535 [Isoptericola sp. NPDC019693]|uniref:hypothetical protein n=1 Tax=Isoptericola sp. NPDC019693 TaxID=3364009 RepID=UPI0037AF271A